MIEHRGSVPSMEVTNVMSLDFLLADVSDGSASLLAFHEPELITARV